MVPYTLDRLKVNIDWTSDEANAAFYAAAIQSTTDLLSLKLHLWGYIALDRLPKLSQYFGTFDRPSPLRHLALLTAAQDGAIITDLEPLLQQCHLLTSLYTSLNGEDLKNLLGMLPITARLRSLRLTTAQEHFPEAWLWREEQADAGGPHCGTECEMVQSCPILSELKHLTLKKRGTERGRADLLRICRARRVWLKWTVQSVVDSIAEDGR